MKPLFKHQADTIDFILQRGGGAVYHEMGLGKTRTAIGIFARLRRTNPGLKMVVVCPLSLIEAAWGCDIREYSVLTYYNAHDEGLPWSLLEDILIVNYEMLLQKKNARIVDFIRLNMLVIDESSRMKNNKAQTTKVLLAIRNLPGFKLIMSGTPAPNSPLEYWAQMEFLQPGVLHPSFFAFRNTYFHLQRGAQTMQLQPGQRVSRALMREIMSKGWKYEITQENLELLMSKISPLISWAKKAECLDLPEQIDEVRHVEMGPKQRKAYREMEAELITEIKQQTITALIALTRIMKLREITSGFAIDVAGREVDIGDGTKMKELQEILEEAGRQPVIIWTCFRYEMVRVCEMLTEEYGEGCFRTLGGETKDKEEAISAFQQGGAQFLVANPQSAAHGLTFVNCSLQVFYSLDYSLERYEQAKARIHRAGQVNKCTYVHILARGTIDEKILEVLRGKKDVNDIAYEYMRRI